MIKKAAPVINTDAANLIDYLITEIFSD